SWQASPVFVVESWGRSGVPLKIFCKPPVQSLVASLALQGSALRQHLAKLFGGRRHDGDEIGLAKPALAAVALQISARAAGKHRRMRGGDARLARAQPKRHH